MSKAVLFLFLVLGTVYSSAQNVTIADLKKLVDMPTSLSAQQWIESKGFKFYKDYDSKIEGVTTKSWAYGYNAKTDKAVAWLSISSDGNKPIRSYYEVFDFTLITPLSLGIYENKYTFEDIEENDEKFTKRFSNGNYYLYEFQNKNSAKGTQFECIKKLSKADPMNGTSIKRYDDGSVKMTHEVRDGKLNGVAREYNEYGTLIVEGNYVNDQEEGLFSYYDDNGVLDFTETYKYGKLNGEYIVYHPNGKPKKKCTYSYGIRTGDAFEYDEEGNIISEYDYINNKKFGVYKEYTDGVETFSGMYLNDSLNGFFTQTLINAKGEFYATMKGSYKGDYLEGPIVAMYKDTKDTLSYRLYKNGVPTGNWKYFDKEGKYDKIIRFGDGKSGIMVYFENGEAVDSIYFNGVAGTNWKFHFASHLDGQSIQLDYEVPIQKIGLNGHVYRVFEDETMIYTAPTLLKSHYKTGLYRFENNVVIHTGNFQNDLKVGVWRRMYKDSKITAELTYDDQNELIKEFFTSKKGKPFSGKIEVESDGILYKILVKDGLRDGISTETDVKTKEVSSFKYVKGEYQSDAE